MNKSEVVQVITFVRILNDKIADALEKVLIDDTSGLMVLFQSDGNECYVEWCNVILWDSDNDGMEDFRETIKDQMIKIVEVLKIIGGRDDILS